MPTNTIGLLPRLLLPVALAAVLFSAPAPAADRIALKSGMSGAEVAKALQGRCTDGFAGAPYVICHDGGVILTATVSKRDRLYYFRFSEPSAEAPETYGPALAAELGFPVRAERCAALDWLAGQDCWMTADGMTALYAGIPEQKGMLTSYIIDERIRSQDGED